MKKTVSIVMAIYNSERTLKECLDSIILQTYPHELMEIIFADGGSTDKTLSIIKEYKSKYDITMKVYRNKLKTAEAGKAVGVRNAEHEIIALIDSDNILPEASWLSEMMTPFEEPDIVASEPIMYTYRNSDSAIIRYGALIGMGDPLCMFIGNYDRMNLITNKWTELAREELDRDGYISVRFYNGLLPTIGANGFFMRKEKLLENLEGDYLFDIDILYDLIQKEPDTRIAKVKNGIVHLFCPDFKTFYRKQKRRIEDFLYFKKNAQGGGAEHIPGLKCRATA